MWRPRLLVSKACRFAELDIGLFDFVRPRARVLDVGWAMAEIRLAQLRIGKALVTAGPGWRSG